MYTCLKINIIKYFRQQKLLRINVKLELQLRQNKKTYLQFCLLEKNIKHKVLRPGIQITHLGSEQHKNK